MSENQNPEVQNKAGGSEYGQPHFDGKTCPECGVCTLHFWKFQKVGNEIQEVYECMCDGPVVMTWK